MPTGYTQMIIDGKVKTPKEFLHLCLRNFGICACMRDEEFNVEEDYSRKISNFYQQSVDYHKKYLQSAENELKKIMQMSDNKLYKKYVEMKSKDKEYYEKALLEADRHNLTYEQFSRKIENWECDPEYNNVKEFALDQLRISKDDTDYYEEKLQNIGDLSRERFEEEKNSFREELTEKYQWEINYHSEEMKKAESRMTEAINFYHFFQRDLEKFDK